MIESILIPALFFALTATAYLFALSRERQKMLTLLTNDIKTLRDEVKLWQNKALPTPLGFETRERQARDRSGDQSPVPKILNRAETQARLDNDERLHPELRYKTPELKYNRLAEKVSEAINDLPK